MPLRSLGFNDGRGVAFRWIAQSLQTNLYPRLTTKRTTATAAQQTTWLKDTAPLDPAWKERVHRSYKLLIDTLSVYPECLKMSPGPSTIAPIDLLMMALLVSESHEKLPLSRLADALHALRMAARRETKELMWKVEHVGCCLVFLERLERQGEGALKSGGGKDAQVGMDVDPPPKRQRTNDYTPTVPPPRRTSTPQLTSASNPLKISQHQQQRQQQQQASQFTPRPRSAVPPSPVVPHTPTIPTMSPPTLSTVPGSILTGMPASFTSSPTQAQASAGLASLESMLATFPYPLPPTNTDRLAAIRAAKVAILNGQHQPHAPPGRPVPMGGSNGLGGSNSFRGGGGGGGVRKQ